MRRSLSRRTILHVAVRGLGALSFLAVAPRLVSGQGGKASKSQAQYQNSPKDGQQCSKCLHFIAPAGCQVVEGDINPGAWCALYVPK
jgi:hypothetical protein